MSAIHIKHRKLFAVGIAALLVTLLLLHTYLSRRVDDNILLHGKSYKQHNNNIEFDDLKDIDTVNTVETIGMIGEEEEEERIPNIKGSDHQVPVIIVDQHNEVIPYWYQAVEEKIIRDHGNTLIHIDGHSDMATPEIFDSIHSFQHKPKAHESIFLPLMQANDVFIISAIMKGLISHVVWIQPSWNIGSNYSQLFESYVGVTVHNVTKKRIPCECMKRKSKKYETHLDCAYLDRSADLLEEITAKIQQSECKKIKSFTYITLSETNFLKIVSLKKVKNLFVDIDEDYFGVESGVQAFIDSGITMDTQSLVNDFLGAMFCPTSVTQERTLNEKVKELFIFINQNHLMSNLEQSILDKIYRDTKPYMCELIRSRSRVDIVREAAVSFGSISKPELKALSKAKYCLAESPRLHNENSYFMLCQGTIYPEDTLNQIHISNEEEIKRRATQITNIIDYIYNYTTPRLFTIARSLRDGYTPRNQQTMIEKVLLQSLDKSFEKQGKKANVFYDKELVFGKNGWL